METQKGSLSINSENIFPIIKKWLYTDKDIFVRELTSNATDAITKLKKLADLGEAKVAEDEQYKIEILIDETNGTMQIIDNGIGMTKEEIEKYINEIAFSGAKDFAEKYKDKSDKDDIIGHFGLGFYSSFMVSTKVQIDTLSYTENSEPVRWVSDGNTEYEISVSDRNERGTTITLYLNDDSKEFFNEFTLKQTLNKYCSFMPIPIFLKTKEKDVEENQINETSPLWLKDPKDCTDEEYKEFYSKVFIDFNEPLFWIHLNMDFPVRLKGILYFPKFKHEYEIAEGQVKLYCNQVFVADNIKEVIPEFLLILKGAIDCPDLPLNVSRSMLQTDDYVTKISNYIIKKIGDKLKSLHSSSLEEYKKIWIDIQTFIKFSCLKEEKFYDKIKDIIIFKDIYENYITLEEYTSKLTTSDNPKKIYYASDLIKQSQYIKMFKDNDLDALILDSSIDTHFISFIESKNRDIKFSRIDSNLEDALKTEDTAIETELQEKAKNVFKKHLNISDLKIKLENLKADTLSAMILLSEEGRRMQDMAKMYGQVFPFQMGKTEQTLVLNNKNNLIQYVLNNTDEISKSENLELICNHIYDLAKLSHEPLDSEAMSKFIERSQKILEKALT
ncbi:MAG: molecular chaperone HtpG [Clostridiales bacterium GWE2_32_10]|nr:MAG: molecular chaperone HtpG [Clostridiales bacterium GWE2_32_10]HBY21641.1 molecular chaperone HtpG [Clostridiales bacterium]